MKTIIETLDNLQKSHLISKKQLNEKKKQSKQSYALLVIYGKSNKPGEQDSAMLTISDNYKSLLSEINQKWLPMKHPSISFFKLNKELKPVNYSVALKDGDSLGVMNTLLELLGSIGSKIPIKQAEMEDIRAKFKIPGM